MRARAFAAMCGMIIGVVVAIAITLIFGIIDNGVAFVVGVGCGMVGAQIAISIMKNMS